MDKNEYIKNPCRYSALPFYKEQRYRNSDIRVIHKDDFMEEQHSYSKRERFFRISHSLRNIESVKVEEYEVVSCRLPEDLYFILSIINSSYEKISITKEQIVSMLNDSVFEPSLWKFVVNSKSRAKVALGICHYDREIREVELDWIQVLPWYRGIGLGKMLVTDLLRSAPNDALIATVSGDMDNPSSPETLYRKCGFVGNDIWYILHKEKE